MRAIPLITFFVALSSGLTATLPPDPCETDLTPLTERPTPPRPGPGAAAVDSHTPLDGADELRRIRLSQPDVPREYVARAAPLPVRGTLMGQDYSNHMPETYYRRSELPPRELILQLAAQQGIEIELGKEVDRGGLKRVFEMRYKDYNGQWLVGFAKVYDRQLIAKAFDTTEDQITDELIALLIQRDNFMLQVTRDAAVRYLEHASRRLSIFVPRTVGSERMTSYGVELQILSPGIALAMAVRIGLFTDADLNDELTDYDRFDDRLETDVHGLLREFIATALFQFFMKAKCEGRNGKLRITDLSLYRNANATFRTPADGHASVAIGIYDP